MSKLHSFIVLYNGTFIRAYNESDADEVIRHHKFKRCLTMSKWCFTKSNYHYIVGREEGGQLAKDNFLRSRLYSKWCERWKALAAQFKEDE